jgi:thioredoxin 1
LDSRRVPVFYFTVYFFLFLLVSYGWGSKLQADETTKSGAAVVTDSNFDRNVLKSPTPVLVDFWASWCVNCCRLSPTIEKLVAGYGDKLKFAKFDVVDNPVFSHKFGIDMLPSILVFNHGKVVKRWVGTISESDLKNGIEQVLKSN